MVKIRGFLFLEDGTIFYGESFGSSGEVCGEVVFNTGMVGYSESLTDPSYFNQILVFTYPLIGNYGIPLKKYDEFGIISEFQSENIQVLGLIVNNISLKPNHWKKIKTLNEWFIEENKIGLSSTDTRMLVKKIRNLGVMYGVVKTFEDDEKIDRNYLKEKIEEAKIKNNKNFNENVSVEKPIFYSYFNNSKTVVVIDCGVKSDILRNLIKRGLNLIRVPYDYSADKILSLDPSGILISNGPGDPKNWDVTIKIVSELLETDIPIFGICLGNQIIGLASGAETYKLKFGHRGQNHPCLDIKNKKSYITSQNHGYAIKKSSLEDSKFEVSFININDKTIEGINHSKKNIFGVQFHPEGNPGPNDTSFLFEKFLKMVMSYEN